MEDLGSIPVAGRASTQGGTSQFPEKKRSPHPYYIDAYSPSLPWGGVLGHGAKSGSLGIS